MGGRKDNGKEQTCQQAYESTQNFINDNSTSLPDAVHAIQDSYPSGHQYQFWSGGFPSLDHFAGDNVYIPAAEAATEQYLMHQRDRDASSYMFSNPCAIASAPTVIPPQLSIDNALQGTLP
jgi:hypothetical protein